MSFKFRVLIRTAQGEQINLVESAKSSTDLSAHYGEKHFPCYVKVVRA